MMLLGGQRMMGSPNVLLFATVALLSMAHAGVMASPHRSGPCGERLHNLGFRNIELDGSQKHVSLYEAKRGYQEVKLMVDNGSCKVLQSWIDE